MKLTKALLSMTGALFVASVALAAEGTNTAAPAQGAAGNTGLNNEVKNINKDASKTTAQADTGAPKAKKGHKKAKKK